MGGRDARAARPGRPRHHGARGDAGRRVPRPLRLGLRRRRPVRADPALRHARRLPALRRSRARARARRHPRRRLQPLRARRATTCAQFSPTYFTDRYETEWGDAHQLRRRRRRGPVREFFVANAGYWIDEFHLDGLRLDATQPIFDASPEHILAAIAPARARRRPARRDDRSSSPRTSRRTRGWSAPPSEGGYGLDALWNDDFHHSAMRRADRPQRGLLHATTAARRRSSSRPPSAGYLYQGQRYAWQKQRARHAGAATCTPAQLRHLPRRTTTRSPTRRAARALHAADRARAAAARMTALLLLGPGTPMLFQGQEFASSAPFLYFADHDRELARARCARAGASSWRSFRSLARPEAQSRCRRPGDRGHLRALQARSRRARAARRRRTRCTATCCACAARIRRSRAAAPTASTARCSAGDAFVLRFFGDDGDDRLLLVNLGRDLHLDAGARAAAGAARRARAGRCSGRARIRATAAAGTPPI